MRSLRSNSQGDLTLSNIKVLIDSSKNEVICTMRSEMRALKDAISTLTTRVDKLEDENRSLKDQLKQVLSQPIGDSASFENSCSEMITELQQRERRKLNVIVFGASEPKFGSVAERGTADREKCSEVFDALGLPNCSTKHVLRIGKQSDGKRRLLRVTLENEEDKKFIISQSKELRRIEKFKDIYVKPDLTPFQQKIDFQLRKKLQESKSAHPQKDFIIHRGKVIERNFVRDFRMAF